MQLKNFRDKLSNLKGRRDQLQFNLNKSIDKQNQLKQDINDSESAQTIIQHVSKFTQEQLQYRISNPVSSALFGVFGEESYQFSLKFETRRGQTEADLIFERNGVEHKDLMFAGGGGPVDVAAFGLQVSALFMANVRPFLLLDEPLRFLKSKDKVYENRGALMINEVAQQLGLQVLCISHIPEQQEGADKVFKLSLDKKGVTQVRVAKGE